nr:capsular biosynthesis protein [Pseudoruegeria sp. HB172150]
MLQGHPSPFWGLLADGLVADGHRVLKVNLCFADLVYWGRRPAVSYRGRYSKWAGWLRAYLQKEGVTDILYYADRLPYHADALEVGKELDIRCWAIEHGYLRPDWLTMEPEAMGALSTFPKDMAAIERLSEGVEPPDMVNRYSYPFSVEAFHEVTFGLLQAYGRPFYPLYYSDKIYWPAVDYIGWLGELAFERRRKREAERLEQWAVSGEVSYNLIAMQIQADYQIRASSKYTHLLEFLEEVFASFSRHAPSDRHLFIKLHPLDNGLERWFSKTARIAERFGLGDRVHVMKGGDLTILLRRSKGVVLVNSTVGLHALRHNVPTYVAGAAVFDVAGLTHQGDLNTFWIHPDAVDTKCFDAFQRAITRIQIKGSFYNPEGREVAIKEIRKRLSVDDPQAFSMM